MAIHAGRRRHSPRFMLVVGLLGLSLMGACNRVPPQAQAPVRNAAAELQAVLKRIETRIGVAAKKVEDDLREANPGVTEEELISHAKDVWDFWEAMDKQAQQAQQREQQETRSLIARSTCYWLAANREMSDEARYEALRTYIGSQPSVARLDDPEPKVNEVTDGIKAQLEYMEKKGITDTDAMLKDGLCVLFGFSVP